MIATTIEQSKHLLELGIDPKTADIVWVYSAFENEYFPHIKGFGKIITGSKDIPAWSLSTLLELLPQNNEMWKTKEGRWIIAGDLHDVIADTPLKAIYKMIVWLKENKEI